ncbi:general stress protein [Tessaracoccus sp. Z1128]
MTEPMSTKLMQLNYPQHVAQFGTYEEAQGAVDFLADEKFPVENLLIVGTNLKLLERVTGRRTWATVLGEGALSGLTTGLFVGVMLMLFVGNGNFAMLYVGLAMGVAFGILARLLAHSLTGGKRDFNSARITVATSYEVLAEHKVAQQARDMLSERPGARAALFE